jgi:23S rRNA (guanine745-N1)-methyltransferase
MTTALACPVCGAELILSPVGAACAASHAFDRARGGYLNLLLSNKKQSAEPGDSPAMMQSRRAFLQAGYYDGMSDAANRAVAEALGTGRALQDAHVADLGCGEGFYTSRLKDAVPAATIYGVDISRPGIKMATSYRRDINWIVASLHRSPFQPQSLDVALSVFAPIDAPDVRRVIRHDGALVTVTPGPDHLDALRIMIYTSVKPHPQTPALMAGDTLFERASSTRVTYPIALESPERIMHLLSMTPFYWNINRATRAHIETLTRLDITVDAYVNVFRPRPETGTQPTA